MEWYSLKDRIPHDNLQVLACIDGVYRVGKIHPEELVFQENETNEYYPLKSKREPIYWMEIQMPEK